MNTCWDWYYFTFGNEHYQYYETICGGAGAGNGFNGADAIHTHMTNSRITDPEILEARFPVMLREFSIRTCSGGDGRYQGGCGVLRRIEFKAAMMAGILSSHRLKLPFGLQGGSPGALGRNRLIRQDGHEVELPGCIEIHVNLGDTIIIETPGGGGFR
jgi:5-oxoprolinase (ATP-hydrolysing)